MMIEISRRRFLSGTGAAAFAYFGSRAFAMVANSPFKVGVITDEISQDFDHACAVAANEFGMQWVELRGMWNKSLQDLSEAELNDVLKILAKYNLQVTDIASPLFKVDWPGAPR